jgi:hypothetical protein
LNSANPVQNIFKASHVGDLDMTATQGTPKLDPAQVDLNRILCYEMVKGDTEPFNHVLPKGKRGETETLAKP